jgi:hypothetical protein
MDVRHMNDEIVEMSRKLKVKDWHFAWDDPKKILRVNSR